MSSIFQITIDHTKVSGNLTNYAFLFNEEMLGIPDDFWAGTKQGIRFYDSANVTELDREIVLFDSDSEKVEAWVNIPSVSSTKDTAILCHYGGDERSNDVGVWDARDAQLVHHYQDVDSGASDSSSNDEASSLTNASEAEGQINDAVEFAGDGFVEVPDLRQHLTSDRGTIKAWVRYNTVVPGAIFILTKMNSTSVYFYLAYNTVNNYNMYFVWRLVDGAFGGNYILGYSDYVPTEDEFFHIALTSDGDSYNMYINGVKKTLSFWSNSVDNGKWFGDLGMSSDESATVFIGKYSRSGSSQLYLNGRVDELVVMDHVMSDEEIATEYENQKNAASFASSGEYTAPPNAIWFGADF